MCKGKCHARVHTIPTEILLERELIKCCIRTWCYYFDNMHFFSSDKSKPNLGFEGQINQREAYLIKLSRIFETTNKTNIWQQGSNKITVEVARLPNNRNCEPECCSIKSVLPENLTEVLMRTTTFHCSSPRELQQMQFLWENCNSC